VLALKTKTKRFAGFSASAGKGETLSIIDSFWERFIGKSLILLEVF
jgi:hypothetical protein